MKTGYKVSDVMTHVPVIVGPGATLAECAAEMKNKQVGTLIIGEGKKLLGILSERDIVRKAIAQSEEFIKKGEDVTGIKAGDIMVKDIITIEPTKDIFDSINMMKDYDIRHLPVLHNGELIGILTMKDVLKIEPQLFEILVEKIKLREEARKPINKINSQEGICELCGNYAENLEDKDGSLVCSKCTPDV
ncbi:CBS domain-containing protein [Desulfosarcina sp.]|nr:CBS domain-containing protein [Desulfosarcina sp.]